MQKGLLNVQKYFSPCSKSNHNLLYYTNTTRWNSLRRCISASSLSILSSMETGSCHGSWWIPLWFRMGICRRLSHRCCGRSISACWSEHIRMTGRLWTLLLNGYWNQERRLCACCISHFPSYHKTSGYPLYRNSFLVILYVPSCYI